jgi:putative two-component system response regulator
MTIENKILLVDDEPANLEMLIEVLEMKYEVIVAINGERALRLATAAPQPDLILLDVVMPGMDGHEVCRRLKADPHTAHIPVIFLSAKSDDDAIHKGLELGAVAYLAKPFSLSEVQACVEGRLELLRQGQSGNG